jgi:hypothetical protein
MGTVTINGHTWTFPGDVSKYGYVTNFEAILNDIADVANAIDAAAGGIVINSLSVAGTDAVATIYDSDTYAAGVGGLLKLDFKNGSGTQRTGASLRASATTGTNGSEVADLIFATMRAGSLTDAWRIYGDGTLAPAADDGAAIGKTDRKVSDLFLASASVVNWNNGDLTLTHSSNLLTLAGGALALSATTASTSTTTGSLINAGGFGNAGAAYIGGLINVAGAATLGSTLAVTGAATLSSTLGVTGAATFGNTLAVTGAATFSSTISGQSLNVTGSSAPNNGIYLVSSNTLGLAVNGNGTTRFQLANASCLFSYGINVPTSDARVQIAQATGSIAGIAIRATSGGVRTQIIFENENGAVGSISTNGSATTYSTSSDARLKSDIEVLGEGASAGLDTILKVKVCEYTIGGRRDIGIIAQDEQDNIPECITATDDGISPEMNIPWGVDYGRLTPRLVLAVQALHHRLAALESTTH